MTRTFQCECGRVLRGDTDDEVLTLAEQHLARDHRAIAGTPARRDLLAMTAEEQTDGPSSSADPTSEDS
jgi:hypothetical protein